MKELTSREIQVLKKSWKDMAPRLHEMTACFYNNLYSIDRALVPSFSDQLAMYKQADKALYSIGFLIASLENLLIANAGIRKIFSEYGATHKKIKLSDSSKVIKAFILAAKSTLRDEWSNETSICWYRLFTILLELLNNRMTYTRPEHLRI
ncbi:hypothetical protein SAMN04488029_1225 [Reichenbachiella faecimaris]|uniref:Hemoglobin-like flavoprotein n=1 Tax=Reichenbachiella faecimaris TaxID=692418 RepID=A0A1W2G854_REIFA|nr:hypothetical protein [Reichenbachiella faecimaris]SMD32865.1 hypothetical protein SAMN04488029_1225 [Reichenbachiella faecimaris]